MIENHQLPISEVDQELLGSISGCVGLTMEEVLTIMLCEGLSVADILDYVEAVAANRLN